MHGRVATELTRQVVGKVGLWHNKHANQLKKSIGPHMTLHHSKRNLYNVMMMMMMMMMILDVIMIYAGVFSSSDKSQAKTILKQAATGTTRSSEY
jgi:hypothetical protein